MKLIPVVYFDNTQVKIYPTLREIYENLTLGGKRIFLFVVTTLKWYKESSMFINWNYKKSAFQLFKKLQIPILDTSIKIPILIEKSKKKKDVKDQP